MNRIVGMTVAALLALAAGTAEAADRPDRSFTMAWFGLGVGLVNGDVQLPCTGSGGNADCGESGLFPSYHVDLTVAGPMGLRIRGVRAEEDTRHKPRELAVLVGARLGHRWYGFLGHSSIRHADNEFDGTATGVAWEVLRAHRDRDHLASYWSIMGSIGGDVDYVGASIGVRIGDLR